MIRIMAALLAIGMADAVIAAPATYEMDPAHTYPSFETDHMGGKSIWRGKITKTTGTITLDRAARNGTVEVTMDMSSISLGLEALESHVRGPDFLDVGKYPTATYRGKLTGWQGDRPTAVEGELNLHGVTRPLRLTINSFMCGPHPMLKVDSCGADASAAFNRDDFGIDGGKAYGFLMFVRLAIQVEANQVTGVQPR
jgi:polyisoprenoid-binding protein YceI